MRRHAETETVQTRHSRRRQKSQSRPYQDGNIQRIRLRPEDIPCLCQPVLRFRVVGPGIERPEPTHIQPGRQKPVPPQAYMGMETRRENRTLGKAVPLGNRPAEDRAPRTRAVRKLRAGTPNHMQDPAGPGRHYQEEPRHVRSVRRPGRHMLAPPPGARNLTERPENKNEGHEIPQPSFLKHPITSA